MIDWPCPLTEHEEIESLAYRLYEDEGKPEGHAEKHWAKAEEIIHAQRSAIAAASEEPFLQGPQILDIEAASTQLAGSLRLVS
jgi:hypothetical protein